MTSKFVIYKEYLKPLVITVDKSLLLTAGTVLLNSRQHNFNFECREIACRYLFMNSGSCGCSRSANDQRQPPLLEYTEDVFIGECRMRSKLMVYVSWYKTTCSQGEAVDEI